MRVTSMESLAGHTGDRQRKLKTECRIRRVKEEKEVDNFIKRHEQQGNYLTATETKTAAAADLGGFTIGSDHTTIIKEDEDMTKNFKRITALTMATIMVIGSAMTVMASEGGEGGQQQTGPVTTGDSTGAGENEGHVDRHIINVVLPTIPQGSTPFNYIVDPERLVTETAMSRYNTSSYNATFTDNAKSKGVFFLIGQDDAARDEITAEALAATGANPKTSGWFEKDGGKYFASEDTEVKTGKKYYGSVSKVYTEVTPATENPKTEGLYELNSGVYSATNDETVTANKKYYSQSDALPTRKYDEKSEALKVTSRSSDAVKLTVEVEAKETAGGKDITLVDAAPTIADTEETEAKLYLGLKVGSEDAVALKAGDKVSQEVTIAGVKANFETVFNTTKNAYEFVEKAAASLADWNTAEFYVLGSANRAIAKDITIPEIQVTWKYTDPAADPAMTVSAGGVITITNLKEGQNITSVAVTSSDNSIGATTITAQNFATFEKSGSTLTIRLGKEWSDYLAGKAATYRATIGETTLTATQTISIQ